uniref:Tetratricopeptide repeat-containing protein n=1 Tax=Candidatus Kentrum sp. FW TaxID=2126338 RepID=A0A450TD54_9GAMM|nr:MAG: Tetratricopeptide repeat-containing protein [Candidatus Kentron sp. FW]
MPKPTELHQDAHRAYRDGQFRDAALLWLQASEAARELKDSAAWYQYRVWAADGFRCADEYARAMALLLEARLHEPPERPDYKAWVAQKVLLEITVNTHPARARLAEILEELEEMATRQNVPAGDIPLLEGWILRRQGRYTEALAAFERAWQRHDGRGFPKYALALWAAVCCLKLANPSAARDWLAASRKTGEDSQQRLVWEAMMALGLGLFTARNDEAGDGPPDDPTGAPSDPGSSVEISRATDRISRSARNDSGKARNDSGSDRNDRESDRNNRETVISTEGRDLEHEKKPFAHKIFRFAQRISPFGHKISRFARNDSGSGRNDSGSGGNDSGSSRKDDAQDSPARPSTRAETHPPRLPVLLRQLEDAAAGMQDHWTRDLLAGLGARVALLDPANGDPLARGHPARQLLTRRVSNRKDVHEQYSRRVLLVDFRLAALRFWAGMAPAEDLYYQRPQRLPESSPGVLTPTRGNEEEFRRRQQRALAACDRADGYGKWLDGLLECDWRQRQIRERRARIEEITSSIPG